MIRILALISLTVGGLQSIYQTQRSSLTSTPTARDTSPYWEWKGLLQVNVVDKEMIEDADNLQTCTVNNEMREEDEHTNSEGSDEVNNNYNDETQPDQSGKAIISLESVEVLP